MKKLVFYLLDESIFFLYVILIVSCVFFPFIGKVAAHVFMWSIVAAHVLIDLVVLVWFLSVVQV